MSVRTLIAMLACAGALAAQTQDQDKSGSEQSTSFLSRFSVGFRVRGIPLPMFRDRTVNGPSSKSCNPCTYQTTSSSPHTGFGPTIEFALRRNLFLSADLLHHGIAYQQTSDLTDVNSKKTTIKESTRASYWDIPVRLQVTELPRLPKRVFVTGGGSMRRVGGIRTGNEFTYPDSSTDYNESPAAPARRSFGGAVVGAGFRAVDDFHIKFMPEVRYTRWFGYSFNSLSTRSERGEVEVLLGIAF